MHSTGGVETCKLTSPPIATVEQVMHDPLECTGSMNVMKRPFVAAESPVKLVLSVINNSVPHEKRVHAAE